MVVLGVATAERRTGAWRTVLPLSIPGTGLAAYHSYLQVTTASCGFVGDCAAVLWRAPVVGLTVPNLSLAAFVLVSGLVAGTAVTADTS